MEIVWTGLNSLMQGDLRMLSFTSIWMLLIYGSAVFLEPIHDIMREWAWPLRGVLWVIIIWGIEYSSGFVLNTFGIHPWVYNGSFAIDTLIRLDYAPAWFVAGFVFERAHDMIDSVLITKR